MRALFVISPGIGHVFPTISVAQALRGAGHDVLFATTGVGVDGATGAGFSTVDHAPGVDIVSVFQQASNTAVGFKPAPIEDNLERIGIQFAAVSDATVDRTVAVAESWRPDVLVHTVLQGAGLIAAAKLGVPAVAHGLGLSNEALLTDAMFERMGDACERHGVTAMPEVRAWIDVAPPSMIDGPRGWTMRYVPYNGAGVLPDWLVDRPERPRIAVTLGTVLTQVGALTSLTALVDVARNLDAELVLALGDADPSPLGELPDNVRAAGWVPLSALLPSCTAFVHHGGSGSTLTAIAAGIPQLVLPHAADQFDNAAAVTHRGIGLQARPNTVDAELIDRLLTDTALSNAASDVAEEVAGLPTPADLVPKITALA